MTDKEKAYLTELSLVNYLTCCGYVSGDDLERANNTARKLLNAYANASESGVVYIGKAHTKEGLKEYRAGDKIYNFGANFVLPEFSEKIHEILLLGKEADEHIWDWVEAAGGEFVFWA